MELYRLTKQAQVDKTNFIQNSCGEGCHSRLNNDDEHAEHAEHDDDGDDDDDDDHANNRNGIMMDEGHGGIQRVIYKVSIDRTFHNNG